MQVQLTSKQAAAEIQTLAWCQDIYNKNENGLAKFGRFPLQIHFWQQISRYHRTAALDNTRLVKLAM